MGQKARSSPHTSQVSEVISIGTWVDSQNLDMTTTLSHFSFPALDATITPIGSHE